MKCTEGYHKQKLPSENFFEVIQYIKYHETYVKEKQTGKTTGNGRDGIENEKHGGKRLWL